MAAPLAAKFGGDLTVSRSGNVVCWGYGGQSVVIELTPTGKLCATFIDVEGVDLVSSTPAAAAYRARPVYELTRASLQPHGRRPVGLLLRCTRTALHVRRRLPEVAFKPSLCHGSFEAALCGHSAAIRTNAVDEIICCDTAPGRRPAILLLIR